MLLLALLVPLVSAGYRSPFLDGRYSFGHNSIYQPPESQLSHLEHANRGNHKFYFAKLYEVPDAVPLTPQKFQAYASKRQVGCFEECENNLQKLIRHFKIDVDKETYCFDECYNHKPYVPKPGPRLPEPIPPVKPTIPQPVNPIIPRPPVIPNGRRFYYKKLYEIPNAKPLTDLQYDGYAIHPLGGCFAECEQNLVLLRAHGGPKEGYECYDECSKQYRGDQNQNVPSVPSPGGNGDEANGSNHGHLGKGGYRVYGGLGPNGTSPHGRLGRLGLKVYGGR